MSLFAGIWLMSGWNVIHEHNSMNIKLDLHLIGLALLSASLLAQGQGSAFTYQGRLLKDGGAINGDYDFTFTVHDAEVDGNALGVPVLLDAITVNAGLFAAPLDFGADVFTGPVRWLEMGVRATGAGEPHTILAPRQALLPTPYATYAASAGKVAIGTVTADQFNTGGLAPAPGQFLSYDGGNLVWSDPGVAAGNTWSLLNGNAYYSAGNVGIGTSTPTAGIRLDVVGGTLLRPGNGNIQFGSPSGELGFSVIPTANTSRADLRFDGTTLKLLAASGVTPPSALNGLAITTDGNVGIGVNAPAAGYRLEVAGTTQLRPGTGAIQFGAPNGELGQSIMPTAGNRADLRFDGSVLKLVASTGVVPPSAANGLAITTGGNVGIGTTAPVAKLHAETPLPNTAAVYGNATGASGVGVYGQSVAGPAVHAQGNATQSSDKGGFVKAMAHINPFLPAAQYVVRCYNSQQSGNATSTAPCGITVTRLAAGYYEIDFGFPINQRFISLTVQYAVNNIFDNKNSGVNYTEGNTPSRILVYTFATDNVEEQDDREFTIIVF